MGLFDFLKSDEERQHEERDRQVAWAQRMEARHLGNAGGGAGIAKGEMMGLVDSARVAAHAVQGQKDPEVIQSILQGAWGQNVERSGIPRDEAEALFKKIIAPSLPPKARARMQGELFKGLYHDEAPAEAAPVAPAPAAAPAPKPHAEPKAHAHHHHHAPKHHARPHKAANIDHDGEGSVDAEDLR
jgi:hypothetical protein